MKHLQVLAESSEHNQRRIGIESFSSTHQDILPDLHGYVSLVLTFVVRNLLENTIYSTAGQRLVLVRGCIAQEGDELWTLSGCLTTVVLRPTRRPRTYNVICAAQTPRLTDEYVMENYKSWALDPELQTIDLV